MKKTAALSVLVVAVLLAVVVIAQPQQQKKIPRIGYLAGNILNVDIRLDAFRQGLRQLGYTERKDIVIESRSADGKLDRLNELAADLVRLKVDVIVTRGAPPTRAAKAATGTIPIVMTQDPDPWPTGSSPVLRGPVETLRDYQFLLLRRAASNWSF